MLYSYLRYTDRLLDVFYWLLVEHYWSFIKNQEGKIELQKKVFVRICVRDIKLLASFPHSYVFFLFLFFRFFCLLRFYVEKKFLIQKNFLVQKTVCVRGGGGRHPLLPSPSIVEGPKMNLFFSKFAGWSLQLY